MSTFNAPSPSFQYYGIPFLGVPPGGFCRTHLNSIMTAADVNYQKSNVRVFVILSDIMTNVVPDAVKLGLILCKT